MTEDFGNLGMHVALRLHQRHGQSDLKLELLPLAFGRIREIREELQTSPQLRFRLEHGGTGCGLPAGFGPIGHRLFKHAGFGQVVSQDSRLRFGDARELPFEDVRDFRV